MQDQARCKIQRQGLKKMANRLAARTAGSHWGSTGRGMLAGCLSELLQWYLTCRKQGYAPPGWIGARSIHGSVSVRGHRPAPGVRLVCVPPIQTCYRTPCAKRV